MDVTDRILLVEDDERLAVLVKDYLQSQGYWVNVEDRGDRAAERILDERPDLVILDLMLPGKDGLAVCQEVRANFPGPILILTAREDDMDQVAGLEIGADDYVKKPVEPRVLLARIRALLRRAVPLPTDTEATDAGRREMTFGGLSLSRDTRTVVLNGQPATVTTLQFELLWYLAANAGTVISRDALYTNLRGINYDGLDRSMDVMISRLRKKFGDDAGSPRRIKTVWGQGYLFVKNAWE